MARSANVTSIDAVQRMATAMQAFRDAAASAVDDLQVEVRRALEWIHHDRKEYWSEGARRGWERVSEARIQLQQAQTYRRMADQRPSCVDEKRALDAANRRLRTCQEKIEAVRHWTRAIDQAVDEFRGSCTQFSSWLEGDSPKAIASLARMTEALEAYVSRPVSAGEASAATLPTAGQPAPTAASPTLSTQPPAEPSS
jgi:hypothetical protein